MPNYTPFKENIIFLLNSLDINKLFIFIFLIFFFKACFYFLSLYIRLFIRAKLFKELKLKIYDSITNLEYQYWTGKSSGFYSNLINEQVEFSIKSYQNYIIVCGSLVTSVILFIILFFLSFYFALFLILLGILGVLFFQFVSKKSYSLSKKRAYMGANLGSLATEIFSSLNYLQSTGSLNEIKHKVVNNVSILANLHRNLGNINALITSFREPLLILILFIIISLDYFINNEFNPILISLILISYRAIYSLILLQNRHQSFIATVGSMDLIISETQKFNSKSRMHKKTARVYLDVTDSLFNENDEIYNFKNVCFSFDTDQNITLDKLDFSIYKGNHTVIIGKSGAGKSTLLNLILGLYHPSSGKINFFHRDLNVFNPNQYNRSIGYVSQKPFLFDGTIKENIVFGSNKNLLDINDDEIWDILKIVDLYDFCQETPLKLETEIGYDGTLFSGGKGYVSR